MVFDLQNYQSNVVAGSLNGIAGSLDGNYPYATFRAPQGIAFLEKYMNSSKMLLVADSGNARLRIVDTDARVVSTWFEPLDKVNPEMVAPVFINVAMTALNGLPMIYISDSGKVNVIQYPISSNTNVKVLSHLLIAPNMPVLNVVNAIPYGTATTGIGNAMGFTNIVILDNLSNNIQAYVQDQVANTVAGGGSAQACHLACENANCGPLEPAELCGNSFLDPGEQCDDGGASGGGCDDTCHILKGYACPEPLTACLEPCPAYVYAPTGVYYCSQDCSVLTPPSGFTVDSQCVLHDIDECQLGTANCSAHALCINTIGSYTCGCTTTFYGDGITCVSTAYAVYSVVDLPAYPSAVFNTVLQTTDPTGPVATILNLLETAYASALLTFLPPSMLGNLMGFTLNTSTLAYSYTSVTVDPTIQNFTRMELVTLFPTEAIATAAASGTTSEVLSVALSKAVFGGMAGVSVFQAPMTRTHVSQDDETAIIISGWGMNISGVSYNRTCVVAGVTPTGGCWQVEMLYMGGEEMAQSDENQPAVLQSKNVLYLPRIDHNADMTLTNPSQALTMSSGMYFPCSTAASSAAAMGITRQATACCLRDFEASYRPNALFSQFLSSADFLRGVPEAYCDAQSVFNDSFPASDVVFDLPEASGSTNDLVVGKIEGMPNSEVRLLETVDYTTRTFRVLLVLEESDLWQSASMIQGVLGSDYNLTFFVGLANFAGTGGSVMTTRNAQQFITVSKSNTLTLSTYGANQDPLVNAVDMALVRIKVTDFFQPVQYLYYLQPLFTMPSTYTASISGVGIVPLQTIEVIKTSSTPSDTNPGWLQACAGGNFIYANTTLQTLVAKAQNESCVQNYLQICAPPPQAKSLVTFGIPLPIDYISSSDLTANPPESLYVQFVVDAFDTVAKQDVLTTISLSVEISALGLTDLCETLTASETLADIIDGNIYIGTATNEYEWDNTLQQKTSVDVPGTTPSNSLQFHTTTVQSSVITFAALGDPSYFLDPRATEQSVNINDIYTINFLEPLGGANGPTPNFDAVLSLFLAGEAFSQQTDPTNHTSWLVPTQALLAICPFKPTVGHMICMTKTVSTIKNDVLIRSPNNVVELRPGDPTSVPELQNLMGEVLLQGGSDAFTEMLGTNFSAELIYKLNLNTRYRKAYVINPVVDWSYEAIQASQPGATSYTVCSKIIAIGMITINTPSGTQLARRLLSTVFDIMPADGRRLLQAGATSLAATTTQTSNSMVLNLNVPGYDAVTQLCANVLDASYANCAILQLQSQVSGAMADQMCAAEGQGILATNLATQLQGALIDPSGLSQILGFFLLDYSIQGCAASTSGGSDQRRLLQQSPSLVVILTKIAVSGNNNTAMIASVNRLQTYLGNNTVWLTYLGGGAYVYNVVVSQSGNLFNINLTMSNPTGKNQSQIATGVINALLGSKLVTGGATTQDVMFTSIGESPSAASSTASSLGVFSCNLLVSVALAYTMAVHA